jgi:topoisomerase-4 subunit A
MDENINSEEIEQNIGEEKPNSQSSSLLTTISLTGLYENWFLDYASYVILERAVPDLRDGFKPVQRRLLHSMREMDDGRYNKVANIIGHTMKYHPHGDRSIGDALVQLGQRELLIDTQGNWGNVLTGDSAAAPRYIEARLSKFANEVVFNPKTTIWNLSYDGRNNEPEVLPVKFPMLLVMGIEGIAVGMASKILPHNFNELIDASIHYLKEEDFELFPDFLTGGLADVSKYNDGIRGSRVRVRAKITKKDNKTLVITEIPPVTNTGNLIESIISANDKGKIKIRKIEDNTAENVEILIHLGSQVSPDQTIDALYAFTSCEESISPNSTVIYQGKPMFLGMKEMLRISTDQTIKLLELELQIRKAELMEKWHFSSLEKIFIRERLYRQIEEAESFEQAIIIIDQAFIPYKHLFNREITHEDIERLTEIKIKRISKYNEFKADEYLKGLEDEIAEVEHHLAHLIQFAIDYFQHIKDKYGKGRERKTELRNFDNINAAAVAVNNVKLYVNREEGFVGTSLRKDEFVTDCSDLDDVIVFRDNGSFMVCKVADKTFIGKDIIYVGILKRNDDRTIYNMVYRDGKAGNNFIKRFAVTAVTRDKVYDLTAGSEDSKVLYFTANPNGEAEIIRVKLRPRPKLKKLQFDFDFSELTIKARTAKGNILTKNMISKINHKESGVSTLGAMNIWYDTTVKRLNTEQRGDYLGAFAAENLILLITASGNFRTTGFDLSSHFPDDLLVIKKFDADQIWTAVYLDGETNYHYLKRFKCIPSDKDQSILNEHPKSSLIHISDADNIQFDLIFDPSEGPRNKESETIEAVEFIDEKGHKAKGKRMSNYKLSQIKMNIIEIPEEAEGDSNEEEEELPEANTPTQEKTSIKLTEKQPSKPKILKDKAINLLEKETETTSSSPIEIELLQVEELDETDELEVIDEAQELEELKDLAVVDFKNTKDEEETASSEIFTNFLLEQEPIEKKAKVSRPKAKKPSLKKPQATPDEHGDIKVSLEGDEPLQMQLDL